MRAIDSAEKFSANALENLRGILTTESQDYVVVVGGSIARREASEKSDLDFFCFGENPDAIEKAKKFLRSKHSEILSIIHKQASADGAFGSESVETKEQLIFNIGGSGDTNEKLTRRILFLLEGEWLNNQALFESYRRSVIERYVSPHLAKHQICRFLLNDIIRYYRTVCVDFEYKTVEAKKAYGIRSIKLRFSRKMLYFGGIVAVAETAGLEREHKVNRLIELLSQPPIQRIKNIFGEAADKALNHYNDFLEQLSEDSVRKSLEAISTQEDLHSNPEIFNSLRQQSKDFTDALDELLRQHYEDKHLIHQALKF